LGYKITKSSQASAKAIGSTSKVDRYKHSSISEVNNTSKMCSIPLYNLVLTVQLNLSVALIYLAKRKAV